MNYPYQNSYFPQQINFPQYQPQSNFTSFQQLNNQPQVKVVNDFSEITANDVPMNVPFSIFAKNDMSEIQLRKWNSNGLIDNLSFKTVLEQKVDNSTPNNETLKYALTDEARNDIYEHIDSKFEEIKKLLKPASTRKKESEAE